MEGLVGGGEQGGWQRQKDSWGMDGEQSPLCHHLVSARGCCEMVAVAAGKLPAGIPSAGGLGQGQGNTIPQQLSNNCVLTIRTQN